MGGWPHEPLEMGWELCMWGASSIGLKWSLPFVDAHPFLLVIDVFVGTRETPTISSGRRILMLNWWCNFWVSADHIFFDSQSKRCRDWNFDWWRTFFRFQRFYFFGIITFASSIANSSREIHRLFDQTCLSDISRKFEEFFHRKTFSCELSPTRMMQ